MDLASLRARCAAGEVFQYFYFWGHTKAEDGRITKACFSQWYESPFVVDRKTYATAEHWMMAAKARLFKDEMSLNKILSSTDPKEAKELGRLVVDFDHDTWKSNCRRLVTEGNLAKFNQNESMKSFLLSTGSAVLVEASPYDRIWGIGLPEKDPRVKHPGTWQGENLLGFALMDVREKLRNPDHRE